MHGFVDAVASLADLDDSSDSSSDDSSDSSSDSSMSSESDSSSDDPPTPTTSRRTTGQGQTDLMVSRDRALDTTSNRKSKHNSANTPEEDYEMIQSRMDQMHKGFSKDFAKLAKYRTRIESAKARCKKLWIEEKRKIRQEHELTIARMRYETQCEAELRERRRARMAEQYQLERARMAEQYQLERAQMELESRRQTELYEREFKEAQLEVERRRAQIQAQTRCKCTA